MFDLNGAIAKWRMKVAAGGTCGKSDLDELEAHLREEIENLTPSGLSQEEAFLVAKHRLGHPASLAREFAKINPLAVWSHRTLWIGLGLILYFLVAHFALTGWIYGHSTPDDFDVFWHVRLEVLIGVSHLVLLGVVFLSLYRGARADSCRVCLSQQGGKTRRLFSFASRLILLGLAICIFLILRPVFTVWPPNHLRYRDLLGWLALLTVPSWA